MRHWLVLLLALASTLAACGRVGPPVRSRPRPQPAPAVAPAVQPAAAATPAAQNEQTEEEEKR